MSITPLVLSAATTEGTESLLDGLDFSSIKEIMDGFDPASLLPELDSVTGKVMPVARVAVMVGPVVLLLLGLAYLLLAPREANYRFGYRTWFGMGSVEAWRFTQRLAGIVFGVMGLILSIVMLLITNGFSSMEVMDMMDRAVSCLLWEIGTAAVGCLGINLLVALLFDSKGNLRGGARPSRKRTPSKDAAQASPAEVPPAEEA